MSLFQDLKGRRFERLLVMSMHAVRVKGKVQWHCLCDCGESLTVTSDRLLSGNVKSCGCFRREKGVQRGKDSAKHGEGSNGKETPEYRAWVSLRNRCHNPSNQMYPNYGGRGIAVCERWGSYEFFLADMGRKPSDAHSIDRINNDLGYSPENCRWATSVEQNRNTRGNRMVALRGVTKTLIEWCMELGINPRTFHQRQKDLGMTDEEALLTPPLTKPFFTPLRPKSSAPKRLVSQLIALRGESKTLIDWAKDLGISQFTIYQRLARGWSNEEAFSVGPRRGHAASATVVSDQDKGALFTRDGITKPIAWWAEKLDLPVALMAQYATSQDAQPPSRDQQKTITSEE